MRKNDNPILGQYRQGDVMIERMDEIPSGVVMTKPINGQYILASGKAGGNTHRITAKKSDHYDWNGDQVIDVKETLKVQHQEHTAILLEPGIYHVWIQLEYVPEELPREVWD